jgi:selenocysteine lyase/cysteine desulfurase
MIEFASSMGYHTLLDAAALAPSSTFSLSDHPQLDAMAVSFYKMFGFPTGVGALIAKKSFLAQLKRPWFAGGNVDVVQVPGSLVTRSYDIHEQFEVHLLQLFIDLCFSPFNTQRTVQLII